MLLAMLVVVIIHADLPHGWQALQRCRPPGGANGVYSHGLVVSRPALKLMQGGANTQLRCKPLEEEMRPRGATVTASLLPPSS